MRKFLFIFILISSFSFSQNINSKFERTILNMDVLMQNNDENIVQSFADDVSFGHSNGWIQNKSDFIRDFKSKKVSYDTIRNIVFKEAKKSGKIYSIHRIIQVAGSYKNIHFSMKLSTLEVWKKLQVKWKLWSRQSVELKP